ncbi:MAG: ankyrin repeat domain-containing protein [Rickettsiales bacterium]|nr:MAG: ankyrin repeat domain-containing protein [Rickettsiales bacterium]
MYDLNIYLIKATLSGEIQLIFDLISYGVDVNFNNKDGITPLRNAIYSGNFDIVKLLLKFVADVNTAERNGLTPLPLCCTEK